MRRNTLVLVVGYAFLLLANMADCAFGWSVVPHFGTHVPRRGDTGRWQTNDSEHDSIIENTFVDAIPQVELKAMACSGLTGDEIDIIQGAVNEAMVNGIGLTVPCNADGLVRQESPAGTKSSSVVGALGRTFLFHTNLDAESIEILQHTVSEQMDPFYYSDPPALGQPVLVSLQNPNISGNPSEIDTTNMEDVLSSLVEQEVALYGLNDPIKQNAKMSSDNVESLVPTFQLEIDGEEVTDTYTSTTWWDTSSVLVLDGLVNDELRQRLLQVTLGTNERDDWDDAQDGPNPKRWVRGGIMDTPSEDENDAQDEAQDGPCWGLREEAVEEICFQQHDAIDEFESILAKLFPQFIVSRLPEAVFGDSVSPLTANAPTYGDQFDYHIDGDPNLTPPSPWTDVFGRYPNRLRGKPRFVSCLLYLDADWDVKEWGSPTRFLDPPTRDYYDILPRPGRCVIMDQDVSHTVVAPNEAAGKRPRYSLVWKLILHPKEQLQDMSDISYGREWPKPLHFGSAVRVDSNA